MIVTYADKLGTYYHDNDNNESRYDGNNRDKANSDSNKKG